MAERVRARDELPQGPEKAVAVRAMFDAIAPRYDLVNRVMTFRADMAWRRRAVSALGLPRRALVLDVACGTGDLCRALVQGGYRAVGVDYSAGMLAAARTRAPLVQGDALALPFKAGAFDGITCGFALRNVVSLPRLFAEFARVLRAGARVSLLEVARPTGRARRALHGIYFNRVVPLIGAVLSDGRAYRYLPSSTVYLPEPDELAALLGAAGFSAIRSTPLGLGAAQVVTATRRGREGSHPRQ